MKNKDWRGGRASVFKTLGASNHTDHERAHGDYYATEPKATEWLLKLEKFNGPILEPACGEGHISKVLIGGGVFCRFTRSYRSRLWRASRFPQYRQSTVGWRHRYKPSLCLRTRVCRKGTVNHSGGPQGMYVPETHISGRKEAQTPVSDTTTSTHLGIVIQTAMCHEWRV